MPGTPVHTVRFTHATAQMVKPGPVAVAPRPAPVPAAPTRLAVARPPRSSLLDWMTTHRLLTVTIAALLLSTGIGAAAVIFAQSFTATPTTRTSPIIFASGDDITTLDTLDFVDAPTIGASGATASITIYGIPGATALSLGEILELQNADTADNTDYAVTLSVSGSPAATLTALIITFDDGGNTRTWNLLTTPTFTTYTLGDGESWEFVVSSLVMTAAASGSQGALTISASMTPV